MAAGATYEPIATTTVAVAAASITFSSIPSTYTDLRLVLTAIATGVTTDYNLFMRFNSDSAVNYSYTNVGGNGSTTNSNTVANTSIDLIGVVGFKSSAPSLFTVDMMSYAGSTYKTCLFTANSDFNGSGSLTRGVGLWRSTSAINSLTFTTDAGNTFAIGTTFTLYGIKAA